MNERDAELLDRALDLAERGRRSASPNPVVGCVIARDGLVLGEGWHERRGEPHAERIALDACRESPAGATAYVSLEPCSHQGRQPPCADALIAAGIARVICAIGDPNPEVDGRGLGRLAAAGVEVEVAGGRHEARARRQNAAFRTHVVRSRPFVLLKLAATLDGRTATSTGESRWISSPQSRALVHSWRAEFDAVGIGSGTALADDPELLPRDADPPAERLPLRVVFDRRGRLEAAGKLARGTAIAPVLRVAPPERRRRRQASRRSPRSRSRRRSPCSGSARSRRCWWRAARSSRRPAARGTRRRARAVRRAAADRRRRPPAAGPARRRRAGAGAALLETSVREIGGDVLVEGLLRPLP